MGYGGTFTHNQDQLDEILVRGPPWESFLDPTKIILVISACNVAQVQRFLRGRGLTIVTGSRYLGGYIRDTG